MEPTLYVVRENENGLPHLGDVIFVGASRVDVAIVASLFGPIHASQGKANYVRVTLGEMFVADDDDAALAKWVAVEEEEVDEKGEDEPEDDRVHYDVHVDFDAASITDGSYDVEEAPEIEAAYKATLRDVLEADDAVIFYDFGVGVRSAEVNVTLALPSDVYDVEEAIVEAKERWGLEVIKRGF